MVNVESDEETGAYRMVRHMLALGHWPILHLGGPTASLGARRRAEGYRRAHADAGLALPEEHRMRVTLLDEIKSALPESIDTLSIDALAPVLDPLGIRHELAVALMVGVVAQVYRYLTTRALQMQPQGVVANTHTSRFKTGQTDLAATATGTSTTQGGVVPRLMLQCA